VARASSAGNLPALNSSFRRTLRAEDKSERTVKSYTEAVRLFADFLAERGHPLTIEAVTRDDVRAFVADQLDRWRPLTALNRYGASRHSSSGRWARASWRPAQWPA
jgi:site-specific recombinase XerD